MSAAMRKARQDARLQLRVSQRFFADTERASIKAGLPSMAEFVRLAIIEKAATVGVKIDRLK